MKKYLFLSTGISYQADVDALSYLYVRLCDDVVLIRNFSRFLGLKIF
ncbi:hypothetical protein SG0102_29010 [Intestinibaculum porci]|uniref:Uncharacterized protein n=1 Tax=Intestinibaculum porci TaxID=2487118 RepID=A0A3G9J9T7_9FIRM|nr:hypothetical protein SG0102_29010 [Intestinibaculum porci]